jgi:hypothetical protein
MPMPSGHKSAHGNASISDIEGAHGYREISEIMTRDGDSMNHANARQIFIKAMEKLAKKMIDSDNRVLSKEEINRIAKDPRFQDSVMSYMRDMND